MTDQIMSCYSICGDRTKKKVNGIPLSLNEFCFTDSYSSGIFNSDDSTENLINDALQVTRKEHRLSFFSVTNNFYQRIQMQPIIFVHHWAKCADKKRVRIMSNRHCIIKNMKKYSSKSNQRTELIHINATKIPACKFCGSTGTEQGECLSSCKNDLFLRVSVLSMHYILVKMV